MAELKITNKKTSSSIAKKKKLASRAVKKKTVVIKSTKTKLNKPKTVKPSKKVLPIKNVKPRTTSKTKVKPRKTTKKETLGDNSNDQIQIKKNDVDLPSNMSLRAMSKSKALHLSIDEYIHKSVYLVAYVSAICFIIVGTTVAFSEIFKDKELGETMRAEVISTTNSTVETTLQDSKLNFLTDIPDNIIEEFRVNFLITNAEKISVNLTPINSSGGIPLESNALLDGKYRTKIPTNVSPGYYQLRIYYFPHGGSSFESGLISKKFFVGSKEVERIVNDLLADKEEAKRLAEEKQEDGSDSTKVVEEDTANETQTPEVTPTPNTSKEFSVSVNNNTNLTESVTVAVSGPDDYPYVELYARPLSSLRNQFISLATKRFGQWIFYFDTKNIPNGEYELFAKTKLGDKTIESRAVKIVVNNAITQQATRPTTPPLNGTEQTSTLRTREFTEITDTDFAPSISLEDDVKREVSLLINENSSEIEDLLQRYAVALQSGDEILIAASEANLDKKRESIIFASLQNEGLKDIADNLDRELEDKIRTLQTKVGTFEQIRRDRSDNETSTDTDGDGISDFDEINLYKTDPNSPDTDNDGVNDGVEIIRGYNPLEIDSNAVIVFESPRNVKTLVRDDVLMVNEVIPLITRESGETAGKVYAEIRGKALPNSFVTLYIFSSPVVVTVKTDSDGSFVYTYDKELEDGEHEVYVAVTDNTGSIIAQSSPFSFIKNAEAFSPIGADDSGTVITYTTIDSGSGSSYNIVIGLAVLSLGIILLMLGIGLRTKTPVFATRKSAPNETSDDEIIITEEPLPSANDTLDKNS